MLKAVKINIPSVTLVHRLSIQVDKQTETFTASMKQITLSVSLSHPDRTPLHRIHLGRTSAPSDPLSADVYALDFSVEQVLLDRMSVGELQDHVRVITVGPVKTEVLLSQWPSPWLQSTSFMAGDPNAQFVIARLALGDIEITERLEVLQQLLNKKKPPRPSSISEPRPLLPPVLAPIPRASIGLHVGNVCLRLIGSEDAMPFALETRTSGFMFSTDTRFKILPDSAFGKVTPDPDRPHLQMYVDVRAELHRTFLNVSRGLECSFDDVRSINPTMYPGEPIFSLDTVEVAGTGYAFGEMADEDGVTIDVASAFLDLSCATEALSIELWQADAMGSIRSVLTSLSNKEEQPVESPTPPPPKYILSQLPTGLAASIAVGRLMLFLAGPDLAPEEDMNISRGVAFHTGLSLQYCSLRDSHTKGLGDVIPRTQKRLQLSLATELLSTAAGGTGAATVSQSERAMIQFSTWDTALRDALATRYVADDPFGIGDISDEYRSKEYLRVEQVTVGAVLSGRRLGGIPVVGSKDDCAVSVQVSRIRGNLHLAHAYNILLAVEALKSILPPRRPRTMLPPESPSTLSAVIHCKIDKIQILWKFPLRMKLYMRIAKLGFSRYSSGKLNARWDSVLLHVPVDVERDGMTRPVWEELVRLIKWSIDIYPDAKPISIVAEGHNGRIRIPFDYVLADLILDINVTVKSMKHLVNMVPGGKFYNPPTPEAEDAKIMPNISIRLGCLCAEAADEPFETQLGLIWRAGFEAARVRGERDAAFEAKAATILAAAREEPPTPGSDSIQSEFQFTSEHTVTIAEARARLDQVHSGAWVSRFKQAKAQQMRRQDAENQKLKSKHPLHDDIEDELVPITEPPVVPPMFRLRFDGLELTLAGPSFTIDGLPDFLFKEGGGMPKDMEYSLLIPMHLKFSVSSLRLSCREYPLPMLNVPAHSKKNMPSLVFNSDVVIAEEMGTDESVEWVDCAIVRPHSGLHGASPLYVSIPKTIMPVKTYANPSIHVYTDDVTDFAWGLSYGPVTQDIMRVIDTLSHAPRDSSPPIGFWDKVCWHMIYMLFRL